jgi:hypothetical protein
MPDYTAAETQLFKDTTCSKEEIIMSLIIKVFILIDLVDRLNNKTPTPGLTEQLISL